MLESYGRKLPQDPDDKRINAEIDKMEKEYYENEGFKINSEFQDEVEKTRMEKRAANRIVRFINDYIKKNPQKVDGKMSLSEFTDFINEDENIFNPSVRGLINIWIDNPENKVNLERSLNDFLEVVAKKGEEASRLLNPGPEKTEADDENNK
jgi:hypothetical protein